MLKTKVINKLKGIEEVETNLNFNSQVSSIEQVEEDNIDFQSPATPVAVEVQEVKHEIERIIAPEQ